MSKKKIAVGAALAAGAGYLAGILTAPKSGKETRQDIANQAVKLKIEAEKKLKVMHGELGELIKDAEVKLKKLSDKSKAELAKATERAKIAREKAKEMLSAIRSGEADDKNLQSALDEIKAAKSDLISYLKKN